MMKVRYLCGLTWFWITLSVLFLDQYTKQWAVQQLIAYTPLKVFSFFNLTLVFNRGVAFSLLHTASDWQSHLLGSIAILVSLVLLYWLSRISARCILLSIGLCLIIGGAWGNVCDRILYGHVIDFLDFHIGHWHWPIFNVADTCVCLGTAFISWDVWKRNALTK